ncbi:N6-adenine methyltransferase [Halorubrum tailed virus 28]|uniref:N6-adenine methyltransferase n=1 Tax=Halorubrum tailed virus 28 TaxID=2878009 RepID=A0AAE8XZA6_9CAUD|nr:DNA methyltransferase [Halorubrum tailed virus 28]UBF23507.1 N6-adenine methyltransferase [Halorubrum tailed virus 28]
MSDLPTEKFDVIYADPPWSYRDDGNPRGGVAKHYDTMSLDDIKALDVPAAEDAILYMWGTVTHVPEAIDVIRAWGFEHKSQAVWDKVHMGSGSWFRGQHELLYVAVRGNPSPPAQENRRESVFRTPRTEHSSKPEAVRTHIEEAHPDARKLEMFARDGKVGWELWGDESPDSKQATLGGQP